MSQLIHLENLGFSTGFPWNIPTTLFAVNTYVPGSKLLVLGMVIQPLIGNPYNGYINPYYWVDDHPLLYGNNGSLDPSTYKQLTPNNIFHPPKMFLRIFVKWLFKISSEINR